MPYRVWQLGDSRPLEELREPRRLILADSVRYLRVSSLCVALLEGDMLAGRGETSFCTDGRDFFIAKERNDDDLSAHCLQIPLSSFH